MTYSLIVRQRLALDGRLARLPVRFARRGDLAKQEPQA